jgi:hypothetical protein
LLEHRIEIAGDIGIPEADDAISLLFQPRLPLAIVSRRFLIIVVATINLEEQTSCRTEEVYDVTADRRLASEMRAFNGKLL